MPKGGIADVEIGLAGWQSGGKGTRRADTIFPITNDPVADAQRAIGHTPSGWWMPALIGVALTLAALAVAALSRRRPLARFG